YWQHKTAAADVYRSRGLPCHVVRYERLVAEPEMTLRRVCRFLGLQWNRRLLEHHRIRHTEIGSDGFAIGGTSPTRAIDTVSLEKWHSVLNDAEVRLVRDISEATYQMCE